MTFDFLRTSLNTREMSTNESELDRLEAQVHELDSENRANFRSYREASARLDETCAELEEASSDRQRLLKLLTDMGAQYSTMVHAWVDADPILRAVYRLEIDGPLYLSEIRKAVGTYPMRREDLDHWVALGLLKFYPQVQNTKTPRDPGSQTRAERGDRWGVGELPHIPGVDLGHLNLHCGWDRAGMRDLLGLDPIEPKAEEPS